MDFYGGYKYTSGDFTWDLGTIYYRYPGSEYTGLATAAGGTTSATIEEWEIYAGVAWKWLSAKYYYGLTDYFGYTEDVVAALCNPDSRLARRSRATATPTARAISPQARAMPAGSKLTIAGAIGYTWVPHYEELDYLDYRLGLTYAVRGWLVGAARGRVRRRRGLLVRRPERRRRRQGDRRAHARALARQELLTEPRPAPAVRPGELRGVPAVSYLKNCVPVSGTELEILQVTSRKR